MLGRVLVVGLHQVVVQLLFVEMERRITQVGLQRGEPRVEFGNAVAEAVALGNREEGGAVVLLGAFGVAGVSVDLGDVLYGLDMVVVGVFNGFRVSVEPLYKNTVNHGLTLRVAR